MATTEEFYDDQIKIVQDSKASGFKLSGAMLIANWQAWIHNDDWFFSLTNEQVDEILSYPEWLCTALEDCLNDRRNSNIIVVSPTTDENIRRDPV